MISDRPSHFGRSHVSDDNPLRDLATDVVRRLSEAGYVALWAGGCVRDFMMGRTPKDYDVATNARPEEVRKLFGRRKTLAVGESFGVIVVLGPNKAAGQVEVATFRTEGPYADGRRPGSVVFCAPEEDAARRDFTINGMFFDPLTETLHDYVGGEQDLGRGIVRAIGDPRARMGEDKLRMLRAVRFTATLEFELDETTAAAVCEMASEIRVVSWERIAQELKRMLVDRHRERAMRLCEELGLLSVILPELEERRTESGERGAESGERKAESGERRGKSGEAGTEPHDRGRQLSTCPDWWRTLHMLGNLESPGFELAMAALLHTVPSPLQATRRKDEQSGTVRAVCRRLKLSNGETDRITWLVANQRMLNDAPSLSLASLKRLLVHNCITDLLALAYRLAQAEQRETPGLDFASDYLARTPREVLDPPELINGADLQSLGLSPGPQFKQILTAIRDAQLNEEISTPDEAHAMARKIVGA